MFDARVIAWREKIACETAGLSTLQRSSPDRCWALRDALADAYDPKKGVLRPLTAEEQTFIFHERLLAPIDFQYWAERYAFVTKETADTEPLTPLWASQHLFLRHVAALEFSRWSTSYPDGLLFNVLKARQLGISTITEVILAHRVSTQPGTRGLVAGDVEDQSKYMFSMAELVIDHLPWWLKPSPVPPTIRSTTLTFDTGARMKAFWGKSSRGGLQDNLKEKGNLGRGKTFNTLHLSELSTWERPTQIDDGLMPGVPARPKTFAIFESTAKGRHDWWHGQWNDAERGVNRFTNIFIPWYIEPDKYWLPAPEAWEPLPTTKQHAEEVERDSPTWTLGTTVRLTREQLYWYEQKRRIFDDETRGAEFTSEGHRVATFYEEYPASPRDAFQHAGQSIFSPKTLERLKSYERTPLGIVDILPAKDVAQLKAWERQMAKEADVDAAATVRTS